MSAMLVPDNLADQTGALLPTVGMGYLDREDKKKKKKKNKKKRRNWILFGNKFFIMNPQNIFETLYISKDP